MNKPATNKYAMWYILAIIQKILQAKIILDNVITYHLPNRKCQYGMQVVTN